MRYSRGLEAKIIFKDDQSCAYYCRSSEGVYDMLEPKIGHDYAEDAACWSEMAAIDDYYSHDDFTVEMVEV